MRWSRLGWGRASFREWPVPLIRRGERVSCGEVMAGPVASVCRTRLSSLALALALCFPLPGALLLATDRPRWAAEEDQSPGACDGTTTMRTTTITLNDSGVEPSCIVVSAGDLVTWVNPTLVPIVIQTADDQFATEDVSATFSTAEVPAQGQATVRVLHAGRIEYRASEHPEISGTILVLGRGAALLPDAPDKATHGSADGPTSWAAAGAYRDRVWQGIHQPIDV